MGIHHRTVLTPHSPFVGQYCPVSRQRLVPGQEIIICEESQTALSLESWEYLEHNCPFCADSAIQATPAAREPMGLAPYLVLPSGTSFALDRDVINLGRASDNDVVLDDPRVSRHHARIRRRGKAFYLFDLASSNGTWVNGQRFYRLLLMDGDKIRLGNSELVFRQTAESSQRTQGGKTETCMLARRKGKGALDVRSERQ